MEGGREGYTLQGNGVVGILSEATNKWERRVPLTPSHCARLLHGGKGKTGVDRIIVQPSTKRINHDALYEDVGCELSEDLSECGLILGIKQPKLEMVLPDRAYAFFSHTHKAQKENMPLLDRILAERVSLFDYELIVGDNGKRLLAFGTFAGRAGFIDFLRVLGQRYLHLGYSTPFLSLGASYMYPSLAAAKSAVISVGEEIATFGLPSGICPLVFVFTGSGNVSIGAQEIFKLLPHSFVDASQLPELFEKARGNTQTTRTSMRSFQVYGCVVTCQEMVAPKDSTKLFDKKDYYAHPEHYRPIFHERIAPYTSVIVNCMYWEKRFPRLLTTKQLQDLSQKRCPLIGISDITCDIGGSIEFVNQSTLIDSPFFRYNPLSNSYHHDMEGNGVICLAVDILPTEFAKEASLHFGDILSQFIGSLASKRDFEDLPAHLRRACIAHGGALTSLYEYIPRMRSTYVEYSVESRENSHTNKRKYNLLVSLSGHLFDKFLINDALDIIEAGGGSFHLIKCQVGQSADATSFSELEIGADDISILDGILDSLTSLANSSKNQGSLHQDMNTLLLKVKKFHHNNLQNEHDTKKNAAVLILGAGRVCRPAAELLASIGSTPSGQLLNTFTEIGFEEGNGIQVIVASLYLKDAEDIIEGIPNATAVQLDMADHGTLRKYVSQVDVVISLLPASLHSTVANACIKLKKHLVTASYVDSSILELDTAARDAGITILGEFGLDPGIGLSRNDQHLSCLLKQAFGVHKYDIMNLVAPLNDIGSYIWSQLCSRAPRLIFKEGFDFLVFTLIQCLSQLDHMMAMKMINQIHTRRGRIRSFTSYCGGLPSPAAANNPLGYKFSWNPAGAIRAGGNPATYKLHGETIHVQGDDLYDSAVKFRVPNLPALALECLPNRNSLVYGDLYGIEGEASTIFRGTLRYEGFSEIMGTLARIGFFDAKPHPILKQEKRPTYMSFLHELLNFHTSSLDGSVIVEDAVTEMIFALEKCKDTAIASKTSKTIRFLGFHEEIEIPLSCKSAFDVTCLRMEERLAYASTEQDMVLLHHEVEVDFPDGRPPERHHATLLEFGCIDKNGKTTTAMACTVGIPAAIGAMLLLADKIKTRGVLRPIEPEVYVPALDILKAYGIKLVEKIE